MRLVDCPCCHGKGNLEVTRDDLPGSPVYLEACYRCKETPGKTDVEEIYLQNGLWNHEDR